MKTVYFTEAFKNIRKNLATSLLLILCFVILFIIFAEVSVQSFLKNYAGEDAEKVSLIEYTQVNLIPFTSLSPMKQVYALASLTDDEILEAGRTMDTIITTLRNKYDAFENKHNRTIRRIGNYVECGDFCAYDLYELCSSMLIIKEGKWFDKTDYDMSKQRQKGYIAPVMLGAKFAEKYGLSVGDVFVADMFYDEEQRNLMDVETYIFGETYTWKVIGIFEKDSSYFYRGQVEPVNSRVLLPDYDIPTLDEVIEKNGGEINDNVLEYILSELFAHFRTTDFYIKRDDMQEVLAFINEEISESMFVSQYYIARESSDTLAMAAQNQAKASDFYNTVAIITYIISTFGIMMSVNTKIQNNKRNYAIHSLNGATVFDLIMCSITEILVLMLVADAFFLALPYAVYYHRLNMGNGIYVGRETVFFVLAVNIVTLLFAISVSALILRKFDTAVFLKKKE